jgi:hypothetical protein
VWDNPLVFSRFLEDCGVTCEHVSPQLLAAPFYRPSLSSLIVPAGFGNPAYSRVLPALRVSSGRIRRFLEAGGFVLAYGPGADRPDAYDWLPFPLIYRHHPGPGRIEASGTGLFSSLLADYDPGHMECDGYFETGAGNAPLMLEGRPVAVVKRVGSGCVATTSIHEYPSRSFIAAFCKAGSETLL